MRKIFSTLLRFARSEQMGLAVLFVLVLAVIIFPRFMLPPEPSLVAFEPLQQRIDSCMLVESTTAPVSVNAKRSATVKPGGHPVADTIRGHINYKPFVRPEATAVMIDLNRADTTQLQQVRGIGGYYARRIIEYRERLGGYVDIGQLLEIRGIDEERVLRWQKELKIDLSAVRKISFSTTTEEELRKHPYIGFYAARGIISFRKASQEITLEALVKNNVLSEDAADRLKMYMPE